MKILKRFWFEFEKSSTPTPLNLGCGVTAFDYNDAIELMKKAFKDSPIPHILNSVEDVDVSTLDQSHVIPNMGIVVDRGVWFPTGLK